MTRYLNLEGTHLEPCQDWTGLNASGPELYRLRCLGLFQTLLERKRGRKSERERRNEEAMVIIEVLGE